MGMMKNGYDMMKENFDFRKGALLGGLSGTAVSAINYKEGLEHAFYSGSKEVGKCFAIGSLNIGICRRLAKDIKNKTKALTYATIIPSVMSCTLTYGVHAYFSGTPNPTESTLPTLLAAPFFLGLAIRERKIHDNKKDSDLEDIALSD